MSSDVLKENGPCGRIDIELLRGFRLSHDWEIPSIHIICPAEDIRRYATSRYDASLRGRRFAHWMFDVPPRPLAFSLPCRIVALGEDGSLFPPRRSPAFFFRLLNAKVETGFILITRGNLHRLPQLGDDFMEMR